MSRATRSMPNQIDLPQWVAVLAQWTQPAHILMVGTGPGEVALALQHTAAQLAVLEFDATARKTLERARVAEPDATRLSTHGALLAPADGTCAWHQFNHAAENGLLPRLALSTAWPHLRSVRTERHTAISLDSWCAQQHTQPDWIWLDCHPAAALLTGAEQALAHAQVVLVRVTTQQPTHPIELADTAIGEQTWAPSQVEEVAMRLNPQRFQLAGWQAERNSYSATAVFVRDHASEHVQTRVALTAQLQAQTRAGADAVACAEAEMAKKEKTHQQAISVMQAKLLREQEARAHEKSALIVDWEKRLADRLANQLKVEKEESGKALAQLQAKYDELLQLHANEVALMERQQAVVKTKYTESIATQADTYALESKKKESKYIDSLEALSTERDKLILEVSRLNNRCAQALTNHESELTRLNEKFLLEVRLERNKARWKNDSEFKKTWESRSILAASLISKNSTVIEFGSGTQLLKNYLPQNCVYTASDLWARDDCTIVADLNECELPKLGAYDYAIFCGVLEYIVDVPRLAKFMSGVARRVVVSYAVQERNIANRDGWFNNFTSAQLVEIFTAEKYQCHEVRSWKSQLIFLFVRENENAGPPVFHDEINP